MDNFDTEMTKIEENKLEKRENLLASAYNLFMRKGIHNTSISDITDNAGVAKGTFYLYFIDKWDIYEKLIIERSYLLFDEALIYTNNKGSRSFKDRILDIADYIINAFIENKELLKFIGRNLSLGIYNDSLVDEYQEQYKNIKEILEKELKTYNNKNRHVSATLFMIIELISSTCYDTILNETPLPIDKYKPILFNEIKKMIK
ncbi:MAG: TetR/AcrR family transcriptional regulator [Bacilli bacterium]|nr:TetR/AcrR family transcriptional regulator [Bacilli bacterium]